MFHAHRVRETIRFDALEKCPNRSQVPGTLEFRYLEFRKFLNVRGLRETRRGKIHRFWDNLDERRVESRWKGLFEIDNRARLVRAGVGWGVFVEFRDTEKVESGTI